MKKLLSILLILAIAVSMAFAMTACGEDTATDSETTDTTSDVTGAGDSADSKVFPEALLDFEALPIEIINYTSWTLSGGMIDGVEMEDADLQAVLDAVGGVMQFSFFEEGAVNLVSGQQTHEGFYTIDGDGYIIDAVFRGYEYYGVFTPVEEEPVLIIVNKNEPDTALYFTSMDVG